jgi:hypothetical protein
MDDNKTKDNQLKNGGKKDTDVQQDVNIEVIGKFVSLKIKIRTNIKDFNKVTITCHRIIKWFKASMSLAFNIS